MGLGFQNCEAQWSYSGFMNFRKRLWNHAGFPGDLKQIFYGIGDVKLDIAKKHGLYHFFNHSDCEGKLTVERLKKIIPALELVYPKFVEEVSVYYGKDNYEFDHDTQHLRLLIEGMKNCVKLNKPLIFC